MLASHSSAEPMGNPLMVMNLWFTMSGIYIWDLFTTLEYEWSVIRRHHPYRWTIWIYSMARLSGLVVIINGFVYFSVTSPINCQALVTVSWTFASLGAYGLSSILIMLRTFAIWDRNKVITAISTAIWVVNLGFQLASIARVNDRFQSFDLLVSSTNIFALGSYMNLLVSDVILLLIMLAGLVRLRLDGGGTSFFWNLLWKQGVIWLAIATAAEFPLALLLLLNVNDSLNALFLLPSMVAIIIAATRMYRSLIHSASPPNTHFEVPDSHNLQKTKRLPVVSHTKDSPIVHIPSNRLEVRMHRTNEEYSMSQMNHHGSYPSSGIQPTDEPGLDVECRDDKK